MCQREWVCAGRLARSCTVAKRVSHWPQRSLESGFPFGCCFYPPLQFLSCNPVVFGSRPAPVSVQGLHMVPVHGPKTQGSLWGLEAWGLCRV